MHSVTPSVSALLTLLHPNRKSARVGHRPTQTNCCVLVTATPCLFWHDLVLTNRSATSVAQPLAIAWCSFDVNTAYIQTGSRNRISRVHRNCYTRFIFVCIYRIMLLTAYSHWFVLVSFYSLHTSWCVYAILVWLIPHQDISFICYQFVMNFSRNLSELCFKRLLIC